MEEMCPDNTLKMICHGCLSNDRKISALGEDSETYEGLNANPTNCIYSINDIRLCWECKAMLKKFKLFQQQLHAAQDALMQMLYQVECHPETLSKLSTVNKYDYDHDWKYIEPTTTNNKESVNIFIKTENDSDISIKEETILDDNNDYVDDNVSDCKDEMYSTNRETEKVESSIEEKPELEVKPDEAQQDNDMKAILNIQDIREMPEGHALETPFHTKRMRMWQPLAESEVTANPPPTAHPTASQLMFVESEVAASPPSSTLQHPPPGSRRLRDEDISHIFNYGSEEDSSEDEEATIPIPWIPRVFESMMETPLDLDEDAAGEDPPGEPASTAGSDDPDPMATEQPWSLFNFEWKPFPDSPILLESRRETFSESNVGPTTPHVDPYDIFIDIWDRPIMEHIASETNKYAQQVAAQMFENNTLHPRSRISKWFDTTVDELYVFFGVILAMGIVAKTRIEEYWSATPDIFCTPGFSAHMTIDRFLLLCKCLHFNDNDDMCTLGSDDSEAKLFKIRPILSHLQNKFQELYIPRQNIALDESLMWKGWLEIGQHIPNKACKGIKTYEICESQTGYLWRFEVHGHKRSPQPIVDPLEASTPSMVLRLTRGLEQKGYTLWMDNFYNSPCLARHLKSLGFDCVGTLRTDRQFIPQALHSLTKRNMRPGQISGLTSGDVDVMVWRDANRVAMISTYHGNGQLTTQGSTKPILILDYNIVMGGLDKKDQLLAMYPVEPKRTKTNRILIHHRRTHTGERPHLCPHCSASFIQKTAMKMHCKTQHKEAV